MPRKDRLEKAKNMSLQELKNYFIDQYGGWDNVPEHLQVSLNEDMAPQDFSVPIGVKEPSMGAPLATPQETKEPIKQRTTKKIGADGKPVDIGVEDFIKSDPVTNTGVEDSGDLSEFTKGVDGLAGFSPGYGNLVAGVGQSLSSIANLAVTLASGVGDEPNVFRGYADEALGKIGEMKTLADRTRKLKLADLLMAERTQRARNKESARGISSMRALDLGTHIAGIGARRGIEEDYASRLEGIIGKEADVLLDRDRTTMSAEERRVDREMKNRDAYLSNLSQNITSIGDVSQNVGRNMNKTREGELAMKLAGSGKYGSYLDYLKYFKIDE